MSLVRQTLGRFLPRRRRRRGPRRRRSEPPRRTPGRRQPRRVRAPAIRVRAPAIRVRAPAIRVRAPAIRVRAPAIRVRAPAIRVRAPAIRVRAPAASTMMPPRAAASAARSATNLGWAITAIKPTRMRPVDRDAGRPWSCRLPGAAPGRCGGDHQGHCPPDSRPHLPARRGADHRRAANGGSSSACRTREAAGQPQRTPSRSPAAWWSWRRTASSWVRRQASHRASIRTCWRRCPPLAGSAAASFTVTSTARAPRPTRYPSPP